MELLACICVLKWIRENKPVEKRDSGAGFHRLPAPTDIQSDLVANSSVDADRLLLR